jgi:predicted PurR-regulated permease PerM
MLDDNRDLFYIKTFTGFIVLVLCVIILKELKSIFIPLFMALLLYFFFNGAVKKLRKMKVPQVFVLTFLLIFIFIVFYLFGVLIYSGVSSFIAKFPEYSAKFTEMASGLLESLKLPLDMMENFDPKDIKSALDISEVTSIVSSTFGDIGSFFGNLIMVLLFLMFMLAGRRSLTGRVNKAFTDDKADQIKYIINSIENQVQHYLLIKTFVSFLTALIGGVILIIGGIDFAIFSALLIFVLNFIPNFGSIIATIFPITVGLLKYGFSVKVILAGVFLMLIQFIIGNVFEPKLTGKSLNLSPIVILISLIFWGYVWGIVGMMLAVPLTSAIKIIFHHIEVLKPISEIISAE